MNPNQPPIDVLLLEDDLVTADAMMQLLSHYGCRVRLAKTVLEAMPLLRQPPQVAILDLMLPDGGGERILEIIRQRRLKTRVAIVTASRDRERLKHVVRLKPDLILAKPVDIIRLADFILAPPAIKKPASPPGSQPGSTGTVPPAAAAA
jgi:DNA-binding response OmpR family regulator